MMYACENRICTLQHDATIKESYVITTITRELPGPSCVNRLRVTGWKNSPVRFKTHNRVNFIADITSLQSPYFITPDHTEKRPYSFSLPSLFRLFQL